MRETEIFLIRKYDMIGEILYSYESVGFFTDEEIKMKDNRVVSAGIYSTTGEYYFLQKTSKGIEYSDDGLMPYFADLTECLPAYYKFEPRTYKNAQLMMQKRGHYVMFRHKDREHDMPIAINSYTYKPSETL